MAAKMSASACLRLRACVRRSAERGCGVRLEQVAVERRLGGIGHRGVRRLAGDHDEHGRQRQQLRAAQVVEQVLAGVLRFGVEVLLAQHDVEARGARACAARRSMRLACTTVPTPNSRSCAASMLREVGLGSTTSARALGDVAVDQLMPVPHAAERRGSRGGRQWQAHCAAPAIDRCLSAASRAPLERLDAAVGRSAT